MRKCSRTLGGRGILAALERDAFKRSNEICCYYYDSTWSQLVWGRLR